MKKLLLTSVFIFLVSGFFYNSVFQNSLKQTLEVGCHRIHDSVLIRFKQSCLSKTSDGYFQVPKIYIRDCAITPVNSLMYRHSSDTSISIFVPLADIVPEAKSSEIIEVMILDGSEWEGDDECKGQKIVYGKYGYNIHFPKALDQYKPLFLERIQFFLERSYIQNSVKTNDK